MKRALLSIRAGGRRRFGRARRAQNISIGHRGTGGVYYPMAVASQPPVQVR